MGLPPVGCSLTNEGLGADRELGGAGDCRFFGSGARESAPRNYKRVASCLVIVVMASNLLAMASNLVASWY